MTDQFRIVLVEDHQLFAESLEMALRIEGYDVSRLMLDASLSTPARLLAAVLWRKPDTVLLDLDLGTHGSGVDLIEPLTKAGVGVIVVTGDADRARCGECISHGAKKVLSKGAPLSDVLATIRRNANGLPMMSAAERTELLEAWTRRVHAQKEIRDRLELLTRREAEVLGQLMAGKQVGDIARDRVVSESTVRTQVKAILAKLQVGSQLTAVGLANRVGWRPQVIDTDVPRGANRRGRGRPFGLSTGGSMVARARDRAPGQVPTEGFTNLDDVRSARVGAS